MAEFANFVARSANEINSLHKISLGTHGVGRKHLYFFLWIQKRTNTLVCCFVSVGLRACLPITICFHFLIPFHFNVFCYT